MHKFNYPGFAYSGQGLPVDRESTVLNARIFNKLFFEEEDIKMTISLNILLNEIML